MPKNTPANKTSVLGLFVSHVYTPGDSSLMRVVAMRAHILNLLRREIKIVWGVGRAGLTQLSFYMWASVWAKWSYRHCSLRHYSTGPPWTQFTYLCFAMKSHFANQIQPSTDLGTVFDFCSHYWECLLAQQNQGELLRLLRPRKHLRVAVKYT